MDAKTPDHRQELRALFWETIFSTGDVLHATQFSERALEHLTKSGGPLRFVRSQGRARRFQGHDVLMLEVMRRLSPFGCSHADSLGVRDHVSRQLHFRIEIADFGEKELVLVLYTYSTPDKPDRIKWVCSQLFEGEPQITWMPPEAIIIDVNRIIDETAAKLRALRDDTEMPRFHPLHEATRHRNELMAQAQKAKKASGRSRGPDASSAAFRKEQVAQT